MISKKHKLPKFPKTVAPTFRALCEDLPADAVPALVTQLGEAFRDIQSKAQNNPLVDVSLAASITNKLNSLLDGYATFTAKQRSLVIGAARYFVHDADPMSDEDFATGYHDDARVLNYVLDQLGFEDGFLEV